LITPSASAAQDPPPPAAAAQGMHIIILIDTSSSMLEAVGRNGEPARGEKTRIDAIKNPLSEMIDAIKLDQTNVKNNTTLHIYEFSKGAGDKGGTELGSVFNGFKKVNLCRQLDITINEQKDRDEAKKWVEGLKLSAKGKIRPTWLYTSIDQVLTDAEKLQEADPNKPISFMVISDGADSQGNDGEFKNMAQVLEKHGKTFNNLEDKYFIELVGFDNEGKKAWGEKGGKVQPPKGMKELAKVARQMAAQKKVVKKIFVEFEMPAQEIWAIKKQGIRVEFINKSNGIIDDKPIPDADLKYEWKCEEEFKNKWVELWKDDQRTPNPQLFTEGKYKITLTVSTGNLKVPVEKFLTVRQFKPKIATVVTPNPTAGKEVVIQLIDYPIGSTFEIKGNPNDKITGIIDADKKEIRTKLIEAKTYELIVHLTLPGGESTELEGLKITTKNPKGEIFVSKNEPWIGEKVTFKSLTPIPDGVTAEYRWDLGDGMVKEGKIVEDYSYQTFGKKNVKLTIKRSDLATPQVAMFPPGEELVVKGINVQIGVAP
jgi:hypothetical protein